MKKVVRMLGLCALVALAFTSCKKKETNSTLTFKATINQPTSDSRTHINEANMLAWDENDNILVFDNAGENKDFTVSTIGDKNDYIDFQGVFMIPEDKAEFMKDLDQSEKYWAYYPNATFDNNLVKLVVPTTQQFADEGSIATNLYPMFATNNLDNFPFLSDAGILRIKLKKNSNYEPSIFVTKLVLKAQDDDLAGEMFYQYNNPAAGYTKGTTYDEITLNCVNPETGDGIEVLAGAYDANFNFVVLGGALQGAFTVEIYTEDQNVPFEILTAGTTLNHSIEAMRITEMGSKTIPSAVPAK
jgi:uncharacterized protein YxeA